MLKRKLVGMELNISKYVTNAQSVERAMRPWKIFEHSLRRRNRDFDHINIGKQYIGAYRRDVGHVPCIVPLGIVLEWCRSKKAAYPKDIGHAYIRVSYIVPLGNVLERDRHGRIYTWKDNVYCRVSKTYGTHSRKSNHATRQQFEMISIEIENHA